MSMHTVTPTSCKNLYTGLRLYLCISTRSYTKSTTTHMSAPMFAIDDSKSLHIYARPYTKSTSMLAPMPNLRHKVYAYVCAYKSMHRPSFTSTPTSIQNQCSNFANIQVQQCYDDTTYNTINW